jgi:C4-dicarboxylate transporter DctM subunit
MILTTIIIICALLFFLFLGLPVAYSLLLISLAGLYFIEGGVIGWFAISSIAFERTISLGFLTIPLFVLMASVINRSGMSRDLFEIAGKWFGRLPGGLAQATIAGCAAFGATTGSSVACTLTIGKVALPEMERYGYDNRLAAGSIIGGGALGMLIPPSLSLITYSIITDNSLGQLFIAAFVPGLIVAVLCMGYISIVTLLSPGMGPKASSFPLIDKLKTLTRGWPLLLLMLGVLGSIYFGICTATESAALGVIVSIILGVFVYRSLDLKTLFQAAIEAAITTATISFIVYGGFVFGHFITITGIARFVSEGIAAMNVPPWAILIMINIAILALGCFLDVGSILLLTMPTFYPLAMQLGFDPIWFGVLMALNLEIAVMTPPFGLNLYVLKNISDIPMRDIILGAMPFAAIYAIGLILTAIFPSLSMWLVHTMK